MPADLTRFITSYVVFIEGGIAVAAVRPLGQPWSRALRWRLAAGTTGVLAEVFAQVGAAVTQFPSDPTARARSLFVWACIALLCVLALIQALS